MKKEEIKLECLRLADYIAPYKVVETPEDKNGIMITATTREKDFEEVIRIADIFFSWVTN